MLLYLYGPETYRLKKTLKEKILAPYQAKYSDISISYFEDNLEELGSFISSQSLFSKVKLGVVYIKKEGTKEIGDLLKTVKDDKNTTLVVISDKKLKTGFSYLAKPPVKSWEFPLLKEKEFQSFVKKEAEGRKLGLDNQDIIDLAQTFSGDTWGLVNELAKMALGGEVEIKQRIPEFFDLVKAFMWSSETKGRLRALHYLLDNNDAAMVFNMSAALVGAKDKGKMADYDIAIKSGKLEYEEVLLDMALE